MKGPYGGCLHRDHGGGGGGGKNVPSEWFVGTACGNSRKDSKQGEKIEAAPGHRKFRRERVSPRPS